MDQRTLPLPRLAPLPPETTPELKPQFDSAEKRMGFVPNSMLIMQRDPKLTQGYAALSSAVWRADSRVDLKLKRLISHVASRSAGCKYCMAHTAEGSAKLGVDQKKLDEVWSYQTSPLYSPAERAALDVAVAAGCVPNAVTDEMFTEFRKHWDDEQVVEISSTSSRCSVSSIGGTTPSRRRSKTNHCISAKRIWRPRAGTPASTYADAGGLSPGRRAFDYSGFDCSRFDCLAFDGLACTPSAGEGGLAP